MQAVIANLRGENCDGKYCKGKCISRPKEKYKLVTGVFYLPPIEKNS